MNASPLTTVIVVGTLITGLTGSSAEPRNADRLQTPMVSAADDKPAFPAPPEGWDVRRADIPHGRLEMIAYDSKTVGARRKMLVYTPPGYTKERAYPVLYLLHGIGGDETEWRRFASPDVLLDNLIAAGKAAPMLVVMPNGRAQRNDRAEGNVFAHAPAFAKFERDLLEDIIPAIGSRYSVKPGRESRALAGLSMGGGQALNLGLTHPDTFGWVGGFSSAPNTKAPPELLSGPEMDRRFELIWLSSGNKDQLFRISRGFHAYLKEHNVPHVWHVTDHSHDAPEWKQALYWFAQKLFRNSAAARPTTLLEAVGERYKIGVGVSHHVVRDAEDAALIRRHFRILTPENCMKPQGIHPAEDEWNFANADRFAEFARGNRLELVGHCLVWAKDDRTDEWMMKEPDGNPVSRETLLRRIETHIEKVVRRYADVATMWDVVNEALGDGNEGLLRGSVYSRTSGTDFIVAAFKAARKHDPDALLIYNDYNGHKPGKREKLIQLLKDLKAKGAPVDAYGMQGHFELGDNAIPELRDTFGELRKLGLKVVISELDIDVVTRGRWWADGGKYREELAQYDPYKNGLPKEIEQKQIDQYVALFRLFDEYKDVIARVSFWNLHDGQSWLNYFPWRRVNHPLLFDRDRKPKPAFDAVIQTLRP
jgi:endo-1,4-beta-xylanase